MGSRCHHGYFKEQLEKKVLKYGTREPGPANSMCLWMDLRIRLLRPLPEVAGFAIRSVKSSILSQFLKLGLTFRQLLLWFCLLVCVTALNSATLAVSPHMLHTTLTDYCLVAVGPIHTYPHSSVVPLQLSLGVQGPFVDLAAHLEGALVVGRGGVARQKGRHEGTHLYRPGSTLSGQLFSGRAGRHLGRTCANLSPCDVCCLQATSKNHSAKLGFGFQHSDCDKHTSKII